MLKLRTGTLLFRGSTLRLRDDITILPLHTSARTQQYLIQAGNGKRFQGSKALVDLIHACQNNPDDPKAIADELSKKFGSQLSGEDALALIKRFLKPLIVSEEAEASDSGNRRTAIEDSLLAKVPLLSKNIVQRITQVTSKLYSRGMMGVAMTCIVAGHVATYHYVIQHGGFAGASRLSGVRYLTAYLLITLVILWHEIGHASALRWFGASPGHIGFGLYVTFPVMYSDVSESWKLPSRQRALVDVGGMYFQAMLVPVFAVLFLVLHDPLLLLLNCSNDALIIMSLNPLLKFDGYWFFADLIGLPNLRTRSIRLLSLKIRGALRKKWRRPIPENLDLAPTTAIMVCLYGAASLSFFISALVLVFRYMPRLLYAYGIAMYGLVHEFQHLPSIFGFSAVNLLLKAFFQSMPLIGMLLMSRNVLSMVFRYGKTLLPKISRSNSTLITAIAGRRK